MLTIFMVINMNTIIQSSSPRPRTYRLSPETIEQIEALAKDLNSWPSPLVDMILQRGLAEIASGNWKPVLRPVKYVTEWGK